MGNLYNKGALWFTFNLFTLVCLDQVAMSPRQQTIPVIVAFRTRKTPMQVSVPWHHGLTVPELMEAVMRWTPHLHEAVHAGGTAKLYCRPWVELDGRLDPGESSADIGVVTVVAADDQVGGLSPLVQASDPLPLLKVIGLGRDGFVASTAAPDAVRPFDEFFVVVTEACHGSKLQLLIQDRRLKARGRAPSYWRTLVASFACTDKVSLVKDEAVRQTGADSPEEARALQHCGFDLCCRGRRLLDGRTLRSSNVPSGSFLVMQAARSRSHFHAAREGGDLLCHDGCRTVGDLTVRLVLPGGRRLETVVEVGETVTRQDLQSYLRRLIPAMASSLQFGEQRPRAPLQHIITGPRWRQRPLEALAETPASASCCPLPKGGLRVDGWPADSRKLRDTVVVRDGSVGPGRAKADRQLRQGLEHCQVERRGSGGEEEDGMVLRTIESALSVMLQAEALRRQVSGLVQDAERLGQQVWLQKQGMRRSTEAEERVDRQQQQQGSSSRIGRYGPERTVRMEVVRGA